MKRDLNKFENDIARLKWACRRGMLELDVLLGNFLKEAYPNLSSPDKKLFILLLECPDPEIFDWLMGYAQPEDPGLLHMTELVRKHAKSRI